MGKTESCSDGAGPCPVNHQSNFLCVPSLFFGLRSNYGRGNDTTAGLCRPTLPPETPGHSQASLAQSLVRTLFLSPGSWCTHILFVPSFPRSVEVLQSNPTGLQSQIPWGFSVPLPDSQVGKSAVGSRTLLTVGEILWTENYI